MLQRWRCTPLVRTHFLANLGFIFCKLMSDRVSCFFPTFFMLTCLKALVRVPGLDCDLHQGWCRKESRDPVPCPDKKITVVQDGRPYYFNQETEEFLGTRFQIFSVIRCHTWWNWEWRHNIHRKMMDSFRQEWEDQHVQRICWTYWNSSMRLTIKSIDPNSWLIYHKKRRVVSRCHGLSHRPRTTWVHPGTGVSVPPSKPPAETRWARIFGVTIKKNQWFSRCFTFFYIKMFKNFSRFGKQHKLLYMRSG